MLVAILLLTSSMVQAQKHLDITNHNLLSTKNYSVYIGDLIKVKLDNGKKYRLIKVSAFTDSSLVLSNDSIYAFSAIHKLTISANRPLCTFTRKILVRFGIMFAGLNTLNQAITGNTPIIEPAAFAIGGGIVALGLLFKPFENHHIKLRSSTDFRVYEPALTTGPQEK